MAARVTMSRSASITAATMAIEMTRYLRAPSLTKCRARIALGLRDQQRRDDLVTGPRRLAIAGDEFGDRQVACCRAARQVRPAHRAR